jgi:hypothetical protein
MGVLFDGIRQTDAVTPGQRFRVTWARDTFARYSLFPPSALAAARAVVETGPDNGFFAISAVTAAPENPSFVLDVRAQATWKGSAAQFAAALDRASGFDVTRIAPIDSREKAETAAAERAEALEESQKEIERSGPLAALEQTRNRLLLYIGLGAGAFLILTNLGAARAIGAAIKRGAK